MVSEELFLKVVNALEELRPYLLEDGGDLEIVNISDDMVVQIQFKGACSTCTMNNMTFKNGVEDAIRRLVPEVKRVEPVNFVLN